MKKKVGFQKPKMLSRLSFPGFPPLIDPHFRVENPPRPEKKKTALPTSRWEKRKKWTRLLTLSPRSLSGAISARFPPKQAGTPFANARRCPPSSTPKAYQAALCSPLKIRPRGERHISDARVRWKPHVRRKNLHSRLSNFQWPSSRSTVRISDRPAPAADRVGKRGGAARRGHTPSSFHMDLTRSTPEWRNGEGRRRRRKRGGMRQAPEATRSDNDKNRTRRGQLNPAPPPPILHSREQPTRKGTHFEWKGK